MTQHKHEITNFWKLKLNRFLESQEKSENTILHVCSHQFWNTRFRTWTIKNSWASFLKKCYHIRQKYSKQVFPHCHLYATRVICNSVNVYIFSLTYIVQTLSDLKWIFNWVSNLLLFWMSSLNKILPTIKNCGVVKISIPDLWWIKQFDSS